MGTSHKHSTIPRSFIFLFIPGWTPYNEPDCHPEEGFPEEEMEIATATTIDSSSFTTTCPYKHDPAATVDSADKLKKKHQKTASASAGKLGKNSPKNAATTASTNRPKKIPRSISRPATAVTAHKERKNQEKLSSKTATVSIGCPKKIPRSIHYPAPVSITRKTRKKPG